MSEDSLTPRPPEDRASAEITPLQAKQFEDKVIELLKMPSSKSDTAEDDLEIPEDKLFGKDIDGQDVTAHVESAGGTKDSPPATTVTLTYTTTNNETGDRSVLRKTYSYDPVDADHKLYYTERADLKHAGEPIDAPVQDIDFDDPARLAALASANLQRHKENKDFSEALGEHIFTQAKFEEVMGVLNQMTPEDEV